jgi:glutathione S-transferase
VVDLLRGEQNAPDYAALNPNMRMPTLRDGDFVLWEANAILQYLALRRPASGLLPDGEAARLDVMRWQFWDVAHLEPACTPFMWENAVKKLRGMNEPDEATLARVLEGQLRGRRYVTGETITLADFSLGAAFIHAGLARFPLDGYSEINRWYADLTSLPAWRTTLAGAAMPYAAAA